MIQRVSKASVRVDGHTTGAIDRGLLVFLGICASDTQEDVNWLVQKIAKLRVYEDAEGRMNRSVQDVDGGVLLISQFTLFGNVKKGSRPSFNRAAAPDVAISLYEDLQARLSEVLGKEVPTGVFGAMMHIEAHHDGPVTLILDTQHKDF